MTVAELIDCLEMCQGDADVYVASPDGSDDYFLDRVRVESDNHNKGTVIFLDTAQ
jgi:hypothetical protein